MNDTTYQGWTNYETWVANLWIDNDEGSYEYWQDQARTCLADHDFDKESATEALADMLESEHDESMPEVSGVFSDLLTHASGMINWYEIAEHYINDITVYSAGWNMPGYMPDSEPQMFLDADDALEHIKDAAKDCIGEDVSESDGERFESEIDDWKADKNGEFDQTFGNYHYFVSIV